MIEYWKNKTEITFEPPNQVPDGGLWYFSLKTENNENFLIKEMKLIYLIVGIHLNDGR